MVVLQEVTKAFEHSGGDKVVALDSVNIEIQDGEFVTVIGTNGSGKSTLLNVVAGNIPCDSGDILLDGKSVTGEPEYRRAGLIGRVFQNPFTGTCPSLSTLENLRIAELRGKRRGLKRGLVSSQREHYREELGKLEMGLEERLDATVGLLSGGQRQALTLLMATLKKPKILLLDEHTAALDPKAAEQVVKLTRMMVDESALTTVMITHSMSQALDLGTRTIMMHKGEIIGDFSGNERERMQVKDLLDRFAQLRKEELLDDGLIDILQQGYY